LHIGASIYPITGHSFPLRKAASAASVPAPQETGLAPIRGSSDVSDAEALLLRRQSRVDWRQAFPDQRAQRALQAYAALEQIQQRDYVSQVLGIDEYV
jgi:hypothetical protein